VKRLRQKTTVKRVVSSRSPVRIGGLAELLVLALAAYAFSLRGDFLWDDNLRP